MSRISNEDDNMNVNCVDESMDEEHSNIQMQEDIQIRGVGLSESSSTSKQVSSTVVFGMNGDSDGISSQIIALSSRLSPGNEIKGIEEAYLLYCEYARLIGFSVKRGTQRYFQKTDVIKMKMFFCSSEGKTDNKASKFGIAAYNKQHTRSECRARLRIVRELDGPWKVSVFITEHNHELLGPDDSYLLRSSRNLNLAKRSMLEAFYDAGIGVSKAFRFVKNEVGGPQNVGYIRKDVYDHVSMTKKVSRLGNADADSLMKYLQDKASNEPFFFWRVLLDDDGRIMNVFLQDSRCASDYEMFGDVVSVDTTFRTNKYNLICAPFVGMNHHRQTIMFGVGFLADETSSSFEWLLKVILESMAGKEPSIIFSDQDLALMNGIDFVFRSGAHRLCQCHINQNAPAHFGKLNNVKEFKNMWFHCMNGCEDEDDFESNWNTMIELYDLQNNNWFGSMYDLRRRWADVFTKHRFIGGLHSTSRSEGTNKVIKDLCAASTSLKEFVIYFDRIIDDWREREREEDALCRGAPGQSSCGNRLMRQAAQIYTRNVYKLFHKEAISSLNVEVLHAPPNMDQSTLIFIVASTSATRTRTVKYNQLADEVSCSCGMLSSQGMFCKHILKVFYILNVPSLPQKYILKRWTRDAKKRNKGLPITSLEANQVFLAETLYVNKFVRLAYDIATQWKSVEGPREYSMEILESLYEDLTGTVPTTENKHKRFNKPTQVEVPGNPPSPDHGWLPPKRRHSVYQGSRKKKDKAKNKVSKRASQTKPKLEA